ncbi:MAG: hypothetical protein BWY82_01692 [Verrucomicrobia bacterium ADurb.Bin474]|nr:MAG: hypothetical protein BWY82_01692 [Verrucomicrobia bacterium ADurb.Bin474]
MGIVEQDIGRHQHRVIQQTGVHRCLSLRTFMRKAKLSIRVILHRKSQTGRLFLELRHPLQLPDRSQTTQYPGQLGMPHHMRLHKQCAFCRIQAARNILRQTGIRGLSQIRRLTTDRDRVHIHDTEVALVVILHRRPILHRADVVTEGQHPGRLRTSQNDTFFFAHDE